MDVRVEQGEQRQRLVDIAWPQAPGLLMQQRLLVQIEDQQFIALDALDPADEALFVDDELVDVHRRQVVDQLHPVPGAAVILTGLDLAHPIPEGTAHAVITLGQQRHIVDQLVGVVVLRIDPAGARLQAHVDVLGHQHHGHVRAPCFQLDQLIDDLVVVEVLRQPGDGRGTFSHENREKTTRPALLALDRDTMLHFLGRGATEDLIDQANGLPALGSDALLAGFQLVQLLQNGHRDGDVVFLEIQQRVGIVDQHIGVEGVEGWSGGLEASVVIHTRSPSYRSQATECLSSAPPRGPPTSQTGAEQVQAR
ncbi:hypothetical protein D3C84_567230 [compost metagenome]